MSEVGEAIRDIEGRCKIGYEPHVCLEEGDLGVPCFRALASACGVPLSPCLLDRSSAVSATGGLSVARFLRAGKTLPFLRPEIKGQNARNLSKPASKNL